MKWTTKQTKAFCSPNHLLTTSANHLGAAAAHKVSFLTNKSEPLYFGDMSIGAWSGAPIRDTSCCCHPLIGVPCLRFGPRRQGRALRIPGPRPSPPPVLLSATFCPCPRLYLCRLSRCATLLLLPPVLLVLLCPASPAPLLSSICGPLSTDTHRRIPNIDYPQT